MGNFFLSPDLLAIANQILDWAKSYLASDHDQMLRPYGSKEVCPFVQPSIEDNCFYMDFHPEVNGTSADHIEKIMLAYIDAFDIAFPVEKPDDKKTMLVIFPNIPPERTRVLDRVHERIKTAFVRNGMMVGQFHVNCDERSVHNPELLVSKSDYPLIAIRYMQYHDILFLHRNYQEPIWFDEYNRRYGEFYRDTRKLGSGVSVFLRCYREAKERFNQ